LPKNAWKRYDVPQYTVLLTRVNVPRFFVILVALRTTRSTELFGQALLLGTRPPPHVSLHNLVATCGRSVLSPGGATSSRSSWRWKRGLNFVSRGGPPRWFGNQAINCSRSQVSNRSASESSSISGPWPWPSSRLLNLRAPEEAVVGSHRIAGDSHSYHCISIAAIFSLPVHRSV